MSEGATTERIALAVDDGTRMFAHIATPPNRGPNTPGILVFQEAYGVNDYLRSVVARFAASGFIAIAPELYHRSGDGIVGSYDDGHDKIAPFTKATTVDVLVADIRAAHHWLTADAGITAERTAAVGFCMGGRTAYLANAHVPLGAAISFYGGNIPRWFEFVERQGAPLLCFWGRRDQTIPVAQYREVADRFDEAGLDHTQVIFSQAGHGFFRHTRADVYDERAAKAAWAMSLEFLQLTNVLDDDAEA